MPEERFNGEQVSAVFIKVGAKCVPKRMAGETVLPAKFSFFGGNKLVYRIRGHGLLGVITVREEESHGLPAWNQYCVRISSAFRERMA